MIGTPTVHNITNTVDILTTTVNDLVSGGERDIAHSVTELILDAINSANEDGREYYNGRDVTEAIKLYTEKDKKVAGIKLAREITGMGLKEAKDFIEQPKFLAANLANFPRTPPPGQTASEDRFF